MKTRWAILHLLALALSCPDNLLVAHNNTPPFQADEVRKHFKQKKHLVVENAGHEDMLVNQQVQQVIVDYFNNRDVSLVKVALPTLRFLPIPNAK